MDCFRSRPVDARFVLLCLWIGSLLLGCGTDPRTRPEGGTEPPEPDLQFPTCRQGDPVFEVGVLEAAFQEPVAQPVLLEGDILLHRRETAYSNSPSDLEIFRIDPHTGSTIQVTANDGDDIVLSANDGAMLLLLQDLDGYTYRVVYRSDGTDAVLLSGLEYRPYYFMELDVRLVNREAAVADRSNKGGEGVRAAS